LLSFENSANSAARATRPPKTQITSFGGTLASLQITKTSAVSAMPMKAREIFHKSKASLKPPKMSRQFCLSSRIPISFLNCPSRLNYAGILADPALLVQSEYKQV